LVASGLVLAITRVFVGVITSIVIHLLLLSQLLLLLRRLLLRRHRCRLLLLLELYVIGRRRTYDALLRVSALELVFRHFLKAERERH